MVVGIKCNIFVRDVQERLYLYEYFRHEPCTRMRNRYNVQYIRIFFLSSVVFYQCTIFLKQYRVSIIKIIHKKLILYTYLYCAGDIIRGYTSRANILFRLVIRTLAIAIRVIIGSYIVPYLSIWYIILVLCTYLCGCVLVYKFESSPKSIACTFDN